jgi:tripartite-type tricarboxylate transporter receptor subunit TctC
MFSIMYTVHRSPARTGRPRPLALSLLAVFLAFALTACPLEEDLVEEPPDDPEAEPDEPEEVAFPEGPIELIVPWAAGGGTDSVARIVAELLSEELGETVNVVNRTGGGGAVGHTAIATGEPDGHTIGLATVEIAMMHWMGLADVTIEDMEPVGQVNLDPAGVTVRDDAEWQDIHEFLAAVEEDPGALTGSGTGRGGIWDLARAGMLLEAGLEEDAIRWVPSEGAAPALTELVAGGIDISFASLVENVSMLEEGRVRALAIMAEERSEQFPDVPTLMEEGIDWEVGAWRGITAPAGTPDEVVAVLEDALQTVVQSDEFVEFMDDSGFGIVWRDAEEFGQFMQESNETMGGIMREAGLAEE